MDLQQQKRRYSGEPPSSGYMPVPVVNEPVPTTSSEGWNCTYPWRSKDLTELFQPFQPENEIDEKDYSTVGPNPIEAPANTRVDGEDQFHEVGTIGTPSQTQTPESVVAQRTSHQENGTVPDGYTAVRVNGQDGWSIPSRSSLKNGPETNVVAVDPEGITRSIKRKEIDA